MTTPRRMPLALVLATALLGGGCGTMDNIKRPTLPPPGNPQARVCRVYGGVRGDWALISEYPLSKATVLADYVAIPVLAGFELTCTAFGDTITLPYTLVEELRRALGRGGSSSEVPTIGRAGGVSPLFPSTTQTGDEGNRGLTPPARPPGYFSALNR